LISARLGIIRGAFFTTLICLLIVPNISAQSTISMREAIDRGMVSVTIISTGGASGIIAQLTLTSTHDAPITVNVADSGLEGMVLVNPNEEEQDEVISDILGVMVKDNTYTPIPEAVLNPGDSATFLVNGYCINLDKANPSQGTEFTLSDTSSKTDVGQISGLIDQLEDTTFPEGYTDHQRIVVSQIALWAAQPENEGLTRADYEERGYAVEDDYVPIIEDIIGTELFPEMTAEAVEKRDKQTQQIDPRLLLGAGIGVAVAAGIGIILGRRRQFKDKPPVGEPPLGWEYDDRWDYLEPDINRAQAFKDTVIKNYKKFIEEKKKVNEKKKTMTPIEVEGRNGWTVDVYPDLTKDEQEVDSVKGIGDLNDWILTQKYREMYGKEGEKDGWKKEKKRSGSRIITMGTIDIYGNKTWHGGEPITPYGHFIKHLTMDVHEESHARGCRERAEKLGLDLEKWEKGQKVEPYHYHGGRWLARPRGGKGPDRYKPDPVEQELLDYVKNDRSNLMKWKKYEDAWSDPVKMAEEEIREYTEEGEARKLWRLWFIREF